MLTNNLSGLNHKWRTLTPVIGKLLQASLKRSHKRTRAVFLEKAWSYPS